MSMSPIRLSLLAKIEAHLAATGQSADALGRAWGDHKIIGRLRTGKNVTLRRIEDLLAFVAIQRVLFDDARDDTNAA